MKRAFVVLFVLVVLGIAVLLSKAMLTGQAVASEEPFSYKVLFCSESDCLNEIRILFSNSSKIDCALYNFRLELLDPGKSIRVITDNNYKENFSNLRKDGSKGLMHNKFCVFDSRTVMTGSFNPSSSKLDRNNIVIVKSRPLSANYEDEFNEMWNGNFGNGTKNRNSRLLLNRTLFENYFCPEDKCADKVISEIDHANSSVFFMAYSFTHRGIANSLVLKKLQGKDIRGVIDSSGDKNVYDFLQVQAIDAKIDRKKGIMHHKVFIIDNSTVITGSFNPTYNGDERNDENILVIHDKAIAAGFIGEFERIWN